MGAQRTTGTAGRPITARSLIARLRARGSAADAAFLQRYFKTGPGDYGEGDVFLGVRVPQVRGLVRAVRGRVGRPAIRALLRSRYHEARLLGLLLLVDRFTRGDAAEQRHVYEQYLASTARINNWDLVDLSAHEIVGAWLLERDRGVLDRLARSSSLWERRIAIVATHAFIRRGQYDDTLRLAAQLRDDREDLIHKATGWMLREVGKRDRTALRGFLDRHAAVMPRTMLRYAIERFPEPLRRHYLAAGK